MQGNPSGLLVLFLATDTAHLYSSPYPYPIAAVNANEPKKYMTLFENFRKKSSIFET